MTVAAFLSDLRRRGVSLSTDGESLTLRAPKGVLGDAERERLKAEKTAILACLRAEQTPVNDGAPFPLTDIQQAYLVGRAAELELGKVGCHAYREFDCTSVDLPRLEQAWNRLVARHPMLRAAFSADGTQRVLDTCDAIDGLVDGQITNPRACVFDINSMGPSGDGTLTARVASLSGEHTPLRWGQRPGWQAAVDGLAALPPLREVIAAHGLDARKRLGQHFLLDLNLTRRIARAAAPLDQGLVVEVGPGPGGSGDGNLCAGPDGRRRRPASQPVVPAPRRQAAGPRRFPGQHRDASRRQVRRDPSFRLRPQRDHDPGACQGSHRFAGGSG